MSKSELIMSEQEHINLKKNLDSGLQFAFEKMLKLKKQLGQPIVTCDSDGNTVTISADDAWKIYSEKNGLQNDI